MKLISRQIVMIIVLTGLGTAALAQDKQCRLISEIDSIYNEVDEQLVFERKVLYYYNQQQLVIEDNSYLYTYNPDGLLIKRTNKRTYDTYTYLYNADRVNVRGPKGFKAAGKFDEQGRLFEYTEFQDSTTKRTYRYNYIRNSTDLEQVHEPSGIAYYFKYSPTVTLPNPWGTTNNALLAGTYYCGKQLVEKIFEYPDFEGETYSYTVTHTNACDNPTRVVIRVQTPDSGSDTTVYGVLRYNYAEY